MTDYTELKRLANNAIGLDESAYIPCQVAFQRAANPHAVLALIAEYEELRKDADRYRWLNTKSTTGPNICVSEWVGPHEHPLIGDELDAAIDAAMGKGEQS